MTHCVGADQVFARWHWKGEQLVIENDRWGIQPIFWAASANAVHVSTSLDALLDAGVPAALDDAALAVFLRIGYFVGNDTPFRSIRALLLRASRGAAKACGSAPILRLPPLNRCRARMPPRSSRACSRSR